MNKKNKITKNNWLAQTVQFDVSGDDSQYNDSLTLEYGTRKEMYRRQLMLGRTSKLEIDDKYKDYLRFFKNEEELEREHNDNT